MRRLVISVLRAFGVRMIAEVATGEEAYERIRSGQFDLVLLDWEFPDRSGESVMSAIRKPGHPSAYQTVIMMSGHDERRRIERALRFGVNGYVVKPVAPATLYEQIRQTVLFPRPYLRTPHYFGPHHPIITAGQQPIASQKNTVQANGQPKPAVKPDTGGHKDECGDMIDIDSVADIL